MGIYIYKDMVIEGGMPQIISSELFENVQDRISKNAKAPARKKAEDDYILTTKLFCGKCERMMAGESGRSHNGDVYRYYKCSGVKRKLGCEKKPVKKDFIENFIINRTMDIINDDDLVSYMVGMFLEHQEKGSTVLPALQERLREVNKALANLLKAIEQGIFGETTQRRMNELEIEKAEIEDSIIHEEMNHPKLTKEEITFFIEQFRYLDTTKLKHRQRLVDVFVNSIYLFDDKIKIHYNLKNKVETLSLNDIESSDIDSVAEPEIVL